MDERIKKKKRKKKKLKHIGIEKRKRKEREGTISGLEGGLPSFWKYLCNPICRRDEEGREGFFSEAKNFHGVFF